MNHLLLGSALPLAPNEEVVVPLALEVLVKRVDFQVLSEVMANREALEQAQKLLFTPDLINYWLSGRAANEYTIASTSQATAPPIQSFSRSTNRTNDQRDERPLRAGAVIGQLGAGLS